MQTIRGSKISVAESSRCRRKRETQNSRHSNRISSMSKNDLKKLRDQKLSSRKLFYFKKKKIWLL